MTTYNLTKFKALKNEFDFVATEKASSKEMAEFVRSELNPVLADGYEIVGVVSEKIRLFGDYFYIVIHLQKEGFQPIQMIFKYFYYAVASKMSLEYLKTVHRAKVWFEGKAEGDLLKVHFKNGLKVYDVLLDSGRMVTVTDDKLLHTYFLEK